MDYVLSRTGGKSQALIQTEHLDGKYSTSEPVIQDLAQVFNDPNKKVKALTLHRNIRMSDQECQENLLVQVCCLQRLGWKHK